MIAFHEYAKVRHEDLNRLQMSIELLNGVDDMNHCPTPGTAAFNLYQEAYFRVRTSACYILLWERHLTPAERKRLGESLNDAYAKGGVIDMWSKLRGCTGQRAVLDVAHLLNFLNDGDYNWLMREFQESLSGEDALQQAIEKNSLVLDGESRTAYWKGKQIEFGWTNNVPWEFLCQLAKYAKLNKAIDQFAFGENASEKIVTKRKNKLSNVDGFPIELHDLIEPQGLGSQKLMLKAADIRIFEKHPTGEIKEWTS